MPNIASSPFDASLIKAAIENYSAPSDEKVSRVKPPKDFEVCATFASAALTALLTGDGSCGAFRFRVHIAPEGFESLEAHYSFDMDDDGAEMTIYSLPRRIAAAPVEWRAILTTYVACEAYIKEARAHFPDFKTNKKNVERAMTMDALKVSQKDLAKARRALWN